MVINAITFVSYFLLNSSSMGGDTRIMIEIIKGLRKRSKSLKIKVCTTLEGKKSLELNDVRDIEYQILSIPDYIRRNVFLAYIYLSIFGTRHFLKNIQEKTDSAFIYSRSHFLPDMLPVLFAKLFQNRNIYWIANMFLFIPVPGKGWTHSYDDGFELPTVLLVLNYWITNATYWVLSRFAQLFLITNHSDLIQTSKLGIPDTKVYPIYGGVDVNDILTSKRNSQYSFDCIFVGRLHPQKGLDDLLDIWKLVQEKNPKLTLGIIGNGSPWYEKHLQQRAMTENIQNISWLGYIDRVEKYSILKACSLFLHTTVYDNNGMAAAEALCAGKPVIMYDLPPLQKVYTKGCLKAPIRNKDEFSKLILKVLKDKLLYGKLSKDAVTVLENWKWDKKISEFVNFLSKNGLEV